MELTRREALTLLLGGSAAAACARQPRARDYPGAVRGPNMAAGHRLRDGAPLPAVTAERTAEVVVVGGGASGLSCAWRLRKLGVRDVVVLELEGEAGGTALSEETGAIPHPWGAHYLPSPLPGHDDLVELLRELGAVTGVGPDGALELDEAQLVASPKERLFIAGAWSEGLYPAVGASAADLAEWARFRAEVARWVARVGADGRRAFTLPIDDSSEDPEVRALDRRSMAEWLDDHGYRSARLRWWIEYGCRDDYGTELEYTSAWAGLHYHAARTPVGGEESAELLAWPEGNGRLIRHLAQGVRVEVDSAVVKLSEEASGVALIAVDGEGGRATRWRARRVVLATPSFLRRHLVPDAPPWAPTTSAWLVANLHLRGRPATRGYPTCWDNVIYGSKGLGYVVATHQAHRDHGPTVWTYYLPVLDRDARAARATLVDVDRAQVVDAIVSELSRAHHGLPELIERVDLWRWAHAMARPEVGAVWSPERARARAPHGRVHFAHSDLSSVGLFEEAFGHGNRAAREVAAALAREASP